MPSRGFTLLESVVIVAISATMLIVLVDLYRAHSGLYNYQKATADTAGSASVTANELQEWVLQANRILTSTTISGTTYTTDSDTLVLEVPSIDGSGNAITSTYDFVVFYINGTKLSRILSPNAASSRTSSTKTLSVNLSSLSLTYNTASAAAATQIIADIRTDSTEGRMDAQYQLTQKLYLRNQ